METKQKIAGTIAILSIIGLFYFNKQDIKQTDGAPNGKQIATLGLVLSGAYLVSKSN